MSLVVSTEINIPLPERRKGALSVPPSQGLSGSPEACQGGDVTEPKAN